MIVLRLNNNNNLISLLGQPKQLDFSNLAFQPE